MSPLHIDLRPTCLEDIYGNESTKASLESIFSREKDFPHAYLFYGPAGSGKTTFAGVVANLLKCHPDSYFQFDSANNRGIDFIRHLKDISKYAPPMGKVKVHLMDEVHQTTPAAQEDLLKLLENDCPKHCYYILCTTEIEKLKDTLIRRCMAYQTKLLLDTQMKQFLNDVLRGEEINDFSPKILDLIIKYAEGSAGKALIRLDQVIDIPEEEMALQAVNDFVPFEQRELTDIFKILLNDRDKTKWDRIRATIDRIDVEPEKIRRGALGWFAKVLINSPQNDRAADILNCFTDSWFYLGKAGMVRSFYFACRI